MRTRVKICGLTRHADARAAAKAGADYLGVVFAASSPRCRDASSAGEIWGELETDRVGVFMDPEPGRVRELAGELRLAVVQLHGSEDPDVCRAVGEAGGPTVWKAVQLRSPRDLEPALERYAGCVGGILLEGWSALGRGGVGAGFDWDWVSGRRSTWPADLDLILAGGLHGGNVAAAIEALAPDVVDVSSGVEVSPGVKDVEAVRAFVRTARAAL